MSVPANCTLVGRWRIVEADIWDRDHLDLCGPATITITDHGRGEIAFGALQAGLDIEYSRSSVGFTWEGFDEMDEVSGDGSAELLDDGIRLSQWRRSRPQSQTRDFFNSLLVRTKQLIELLQLQQQYLMRGTQAISSVTRRACVRAEVFVVPPERVCLGSSRGTFPRRSRSH
jgi:hypothetical protein